MKLLYRINILILLVFVLSSSLLAKDKPTLDSEVFGWELISESFGIKMYERWVELEKDVKVRERSGKMILHCSIEEVIELISDISRTQLWMNNVEKVEVIKSVSVKEWYQRTVLDAPWPFSKQDMISRYIVKHDKEKNVAKVTILRETNLYPEQDGVNRLDSFNAEWEIVAINENKVKVTFTTKSTKPPEYPCWVQDPVVRNMFFSNLKNFKKLLAHA